MNIQITGIFLLPIVSILTIVLLYPLRTIPKKYIGLFFTISSFVLFILSCFVFLDFHTPENPEIFAMEFLRIDSFILRFSIYLNSLTAVMLFVVCSVSFLVHMFSLGYMKDFEYPRYYIFLHLFTWSMLGLVLAGNLIQMFVFWELVGLCSYLLIGFWYDKKSATDAAKKAFIITRIGDFGFMIGILYIVANISKITPVISTGLNTFSDPLSITYLNQALQSPAGSEFALIFSLGILFGAIGKSAQFPLHTWLPDAMEGPTPVSALIHAATMVAAGVFLIGRFLPVFPDEVLQLTVIIGAITALGAAILGTVMNDVKKVLAYSTISQLGYMVMALGMFLSTAAFFHLFTHAFFKALLFLGAGSLSHAVGTFDMKKMGGLKRFMPWTYMFFIIGTFSLVGFFPFSGFWSKDEILAQIIDSNRNLNNLIYIIGSAGVFFTSFYMFRALFMIFEGNYDGRKNPGVRVHESNYILLIPMGLLAFGSLFFGFLFNAPFELGFIKAHWFNHFIDHDFHAHKFNYQVALISHLLGLLGFISAFLQYKYQKKAFTTLNPLRNILIEKYYLDHLYENLIVRNLFYSKLTSLMVYIDKNIIDRTWDNCAVSIKKISSQLSVIQNGQAQQYLIGIPLGLFIVTFVFLLWG